MKTRKEFIDFLEEEFLDSEGNQINNPHMYHLEIEKNRDEEGYGTVTLVAGGDKLWVYEGRFQDIVSIVRTWLKI